jgi:hypothetical protein
MEHSQSISAIIKRISFVHFSLLKEPFLDVRAEVAYENADTQFFALTELENSWDDEKTFLGSISSMHVVQTRSSCD